MLNRTIHRSETIYRRLLLPKPDWIATAYRPRDDGVVPDPLDGVVSDSFDFTFESLIAFDSLKKIAFNCPIKFRFGESRGTSSAKNYRWLA